MDIWKLKELYDEQREERIRKLEQLRHVGRYHGPERRDPVRRVES